jgi:hypothetical protein
MAKRSPNGDVVQALGYAALFVGAVWGLSYLANGRGKNNNSPFVPDAIENRMDDVVEALNDIIGRHWVTVTLDFLQARMALAMPGAAAFVRAAHWAEHHYAGQAGPIKKQAALRALTA